MFCRWQSHTNLCALCQCTKFGPNTYHDCRLEAAWTKTIFTPAQWRRLPHRSRSPLFTGAITPVNIFPDYMHVKFLGWLQYCMGSILWLLCYQILPDSALQNLGACWNFVKQHQKLNKHLGPRNYSKSVTQFVDFFTGDIISRSKCKTISCPFLH